MQVERRVAISLLQLRVERVEELRIIASLLKHFSEPPIIQTGQSWPALAFVTHLIALAYSTAEANTGKVSAAWIPATDRLIVLVLGKLRLLAELDDFRLPLRPWWRCWIGSRSRKNYATKLRKPCARRAPPRRRLGTPGRSPRRTAARSCPRSSGSTPPPAPTGLLRFSIVGSHIGVTIRLQEIQCFNWNLMLRNIHFN